MIQTLHVWKVHGLAPQLLLKFIEDKERENHSGENSDDEIVKTEHIEVPTRVVHGRSTRKCR